MNTLLRRVARQLRYRPLPELIGATVNLESAKTAPDTIAAALAGSFPLTLRFLEPQEPWITVALAKYCIMDLTFAVDGVEWQPGDTPGTSVLKDLGFAVHPSDVADDQRQAEIENDDPTCLSQLAEGIDRDQAVLRVFVEEVPRRKLVEYWKDLLKAKRGNLSEGGIMEAKTVLDRFFPRQMAISDACLTNAPFIWFHKHFYM